MPYRYGYANYGQGSGGGKGGYPPGGAPVSLMFDSFDMTNAAIWDLQKRRSDYEGYAVQVALAADSGATTLDIGFNADGSFDMDAYDAFGTGSERVVVWYDQSGNGHDLSRAWSATLCPIIRTSSYNTSPCVYFSTGSLGNSGFTDWNGLADLNLIFACRPVTNTAGYQFNGGSGKHSLYGGYTGWYLFENGYSGYVRYLSMWERLNGMLYRVRFDGGGATDSDQLKLYSNDQVSGTASEGSGVPTTWTSETGFYLNGEAAGTNAKDTEYFGVYYLGQDIDADWATLKADIVADYFTTTDSQLIVSGDSLTVSYNLNGTDPTNTYPLQTKGLLATDTGRTWNVPTVTATAEIAAALARIEQLATNNGIYLVDDWQQHRIVVCWGGTNDLAAAGTYTDALTASDSLAQAWLDYGASKVYFLNMLPRTDLGAGNAAFETARGNYNSGLAAALPAGVDVIDVAGIAALADSTDTDWYIDNVHLTFNGYALIADAVRDAIEADL